MASGSRTTLKIEPRDERGSRAGRRLRRAGFVPGIVYGTGSEPAPFKVNGRELRSVMVEGHALFDVALDGKNAQPVVLKDSQRDPVKGNVTHIDLLLVRLDEKIQSTVPLEIEGTEEAPGVKEGGVLSHVTREVIVESLPTAIPDRITADVSGLDIGENLTLDAVPVPDGVDFVAEAPNEIVVATVGAPSKVEEPEALEEEAVLIGEDGEPIEGEAAEGEQAEGEGEKPEGEGGGESEG
jgi:large subunit ribosomal protein L25